MQTNPETRQIPAMPAPAFCAAARQIISDPAYCSTRPLARRFAWIVLMAERGHTCNQFRIAEMQAGVK